MPVIGQKQRAEAEGRDEGQRQRAGPPYSI
jgi:hypothetical protein